MDTRRSSRLLSIGEFSAATQLSPKALRLYDEQRILRPAVVDAANGYRYYRDDQIPIGRLIRTLRDMDLPLTGVADVVSTEAGRAEALLRQFAQEGERQFARQKRAYQAALSLLRQGRPADSPTITERRTAALTVVVRPFLAERRSLIERYRAELAAGFTALAESGLAPAGEPLCVLVDPLSDEEGRVEASIPIAAPTAMPRGVTVRQMPACDCAVLTTEFADASALDLTAGLDALFDWFDRRGCHAVESSTVSFTTTDTGLRAEIVWAYEPVSVSDF